MAARAQVQGEIRYNEPLSKHTTWRVGGPAQEFFKPLDKDDLVNFLEQRNADLPIMWLGLGSNLLIRDGGFSGTVIATIGCLDDLYLDDDLMVIESGASCAKVARFAARNNLCGAEFLAGIPGTMGGALAMNAGAFGGETWQRVAWVSTVNKHGQICVRQPREYEVGYRSVQGPEDEWFISAALRLEEGNVEEGQAKIRELLKVRNSKQPIGQPSCGSVFRNPEGDHAARLIEVAGLKGKEIGGAQVSLKHANFIINTGNATADDLEKLILLVQREVEANSSIKLETEVHIVGDRGLNQ